MNSKAFPRSAAGRFRRRAGGGRPARRGRGCRGHRRSAAACLLGPPWRRAAGEGGRGAVDSRQAVWPPIRVRLHTSTEAFGLSPGGGLRVWLRDRHQRDRTGIRVSRHGAAVGDSANVVQDTNVTRADSESVRDGPCPGRPPGPPGLSPVGRGQRQARAALAVTVTGPEITADSDGSPGSARPEPRDNLNSESGLARLVTLIRVSASDSEAETLISQCLEPEGDNLAP